MDITPFEIVVSSDQIAELMARLALTRFPESAEAEGWEYGTNTDYLRELVDYWQHGYDWFEQQRRLNGFRQFIAEIEGRKLHFLYLPGERPDALPIVLSHGWPSGYHEMTRLAVRLAHPSAFGGSADDSFSVIVPSIPGFGYSDPIPHGGYHAAAGQLYQLLTDGLGLERFALHSTGAGAFVNGWLAIEHPESVVGYHTHDPMLMPPAIPSAGPLSAEEAAFQERARAWGADEGAYATLHRTKPQSIGHALADSPAGLASWLVEKHRSWSDCDGDLERRYSKDEFLTQCTWYWVTNSITSSIRMYYERVRHDPPVPAGQRFEVPTGVAIPRDHPTFPTRRAPRSVLERTHDLQHWVDLPSGGHFASWEEPDLVADSIRTFLADRR